MNRKILNRGFTLIEIALYTALFIMIIFTTINVGIFLARESNESMYRNFLISESRIIFDNVINLLSSGVTIDTGQSSFGSDFSSIKFTDTDGQDIRIFVNGSENTNLVKQINGGQPMSMHSDDISVTKFKLEYINQSGLVPLIKVEIIFKDPINQQLKLISSTNFSYE